MAVSLNVVVPPLVEPVLLADMKNYLRVNYSDDDTEISGMISSARELVEIFTARSFVTKGYMQSSDSFPYFTDTVMSQLAYPPSYYSLPRYSTTFWNYSQQIKLFMSPLVSVSRIVYLSSADQQYHTLMPPDPLWYPGTSYPINFVVDDGNGNRQQALNAGVAGNQPPAVWNPQLNGTTNDTGSPVIVWQNIGPSPLNPVGPAGLSANTFFPDNLNEPPRIFPGPAGATWPPVLYAPNAVQIYFTAGYGPGVQSANSSGPYPYLPPPGLPYRALTAIKQTVAGWYENRESITPLNMKELPNHVQQLLWSLRVLDMQPTRG